jgi:hypothetical protein
MTRTGFYILVGMAVVWGALRASEVMLFDSCKADQVELDSLDVKLESARKLNLFNAQLLRQLVIDSHSDPVLVDLLAKHHVKVVVSPSQPDASTPAPAAPGETGPAPPEAPVKP